MIDWTSLLVPGISVLEKILRPLAVYVFLLVAFRVVGKRELGQMTPFDLVMLLTISNVLQNAMIGNDNSLSGGVLGALTLFVANRTMSGLAVRLPRLENWFEGQPTRLIEDGRILGGNLKREMMTRLDLERAIRKHDLDPATDLGSIKLALLETDGTVTIVRREPGRTG
jgi:uncharacterized membrane protein YcaP (DUF421 family)